MRSEKYKNWVAKPDPKTCIDCRRNHGKIYLIGEPVIPAPPLHPHCRCEIKWLGALSAGTATQKWLDGADFYLTWMGELPEYYITEQDAKALGYKPRRGNLSDVAPGKMLAKGVYYNDDGHLPSKNGRIWYEADINYYGGYRGTDRILYSK